jgi:hypothetical protein
MFIARLFFGHDWIIVAVIVVISLHGRLPRINANLREILRCRHCGWRSLHPTHCLHCGQPRQGAPFERRR